jgi:hypothetical protein
MVQPILDFCQGHIYSLKLREDWIWEQGGGHDETSDGHFSSVQV